MHNIISPMIRWVVRHSLSLILIIVVLIAGNFLRKEYRDYNLSKDEGPVLESAKQEIDKYRLLSEQNASQRVAKFKAVPLNTLNSRIKVIDLDILKKQSEQQEIGDGLELLMKFPVGNGIVEHKKLELEIMILRQERDYLVQLSGLITESNELESLRKVHAVAYNKLRSNEKDQQSLKNAHPLAVMNPAYHEYWRLKRLKESHLVLLNINQNAYENYQKKLKILQEIKASTRPFKIARENIDKVLEPLINKINDYKKRILNNWFEKASNTISEVIWIAVSILLSIILIPIAIKFFFYYVLAPLASRRPAICILPKVLGSIDGLAESKDAGQSSAKISAVSLQLKINTDQELLILPEYLQSSSVGGEKDTKWLLSYKLPLSSLVSGMVALTRIRTKSNESVVISSTKDPLSEMGIISLPNGSAIVLQPRSLVGVIHCKELPIQITRHWRILSLHAWLTLQLRYLVFHGPAKLIVKGCRGIRLEKAGAGRLINQAATIGFSANLEYSTTRCETFVSYLMAKQELLNDSFVGESGFYIYEEMPNFGNSSGITGRGLEGLTDAVLKVFGI